MPRLREWGWRIGLVACSLVIVLVLGEAALRLVLPAGDVLMPALTHNDILGVRVRPGATGFDDWGFRNPRVPPRVDIVAIGDSFTYGYAARRVDAWPSRLAQIAGVSVYNLSMGGWGPAQYYCALRIFGLRLTPKAVVVALYLGNDLQDAIHAGDAPARCESMSPDALHGLDRGPIAASADRRLLGPWRDWLARHSLLYQAAKLGLPRLSGVIASRLVVGDHHTLREIRGHRVVLERTSWLAAHPDVVAAGSVKLVAILEKIAGVCRDRHLGCIVVLIPSREAVYAEFAPDAPGLKDAMGVESALAERVESALGGDLVFVKPLGALRQAVSGGRQIYPSSEDGHFNAAGYAVVAEEVAKGLGALSRRRDARRPHALAAAPDPALH